MFATSNHVDVFVCYRTWCVYGVSYTEIGEQHWKGQQTGVIMRREEMNHAMHIMPAHHHMKDHQNGQVQENLTGVP